MGTAQWEHKRQFDRVTSRHSTYIKRSVADALNLKYFFFFQSLAGFRGHFSLQSNDLLLLSVLIFVLTTARVCCQCLQILLGIEKHDFQESIMRGSISRCERARPSCLHFSMPVSCFWSISLQGLRSPPFTCSAQSE